MKRSSGREDTMDIGDTMDTMDIGDTMDNLDDKYRNPNDDTKIIRWAIN